MSSELSELNFKQTYLPSKYDTPTTFESLINSFWSDHAVYKELNNTKTRQQCLLSTRLRVLFRRFFAPVYWKEFRLDCLGLGIQFGLVLIKAHRRMRNCET